MPKSQDKLIESIKENYYTAKEAYEYLGMSRDTFNNWVRRNPDEFGQANILGKNSHYLKDRVHNFKEKIEALLLASHRSNFVFRPATMEDLEQEDRMAYLNFGAGSISSERKASRRRFLKANPFSSFHLYDDDVLKAFINLIPMRHDAILEFQKGKRGWLFENEKIEQYVPGKRLECIIIDLATITNAPPERRDRYAAYLLHHLGLQLIEWAKMGVDIKSIDACAGTDEGKKILENAKFEDKGVFKTPAIGKPEIFVDRAMYHLEVDQSDLVLLQKYRKTLEEWKKSH